MTATAVRPKLRIISSPLLAQIPASPVRQLPTVAKRAAAPQEVRPADHCRCTERCALTDPQRVAVAIAAAATEVVRGLRPVTQLTRWLSTEANEILLRRVSLVARANQRVVRRPAVVLGSRICRVGHDVAEGTVTLREGDRVRAVVVRLEAYRGRWRAALVEML